MIPADPTVDWAAARAASLRYLRAAGLVTMGLGTLFSLVGLVAGAVIWALTGQVVMAGAAAASGVVAGFVTTRRGRKTMIGEPLVVEGAVLRKGRQPVGTNPKKPKERLLLVMRVARARRLRHDGGLETEPDRAGERTIVAREPLFVRVEAGERLALVCLPGGEAIARLDDFPLGRPNG